MKTLSTNIMRMGNEGFSYYYRMYSSRIKSMEIFMMVVLFIFNYTTINVQAQTTSSQYLNQVASEVTIEGALTMYMVTRYGDEIQAIDSYRKTTGEGEFVAFIVKTDKRMDMGRYLDGEELEALRENNETMQSEFLIVPNWEVIKPFSEKDFAAQFANKRVRITGTFFFPWAGWHYVTPVAMEYTKIEVKE